MNFEEPFMEKLIWLSFKQVNDETFKAAMFQIKPESTRLSHLYLIIWVALYVIN